MKIICLLLIMTTCYCCAAQTKADYEIAIARFTKFYNSKQADSIQNMWSPKEDNMWDVKMTEGVNKKYGKIVSYKYLGIDSTDTEQHGLAVFKIQFSKAGKKALSLTMEKGKYLGTFRFITSSPHIDKMLREAK